MNKSIQFSVKENYVSPVMKIAAMRTKRHILSGSYGDEGSAGQDGGYDPYNDENDL